MVDGAEGPGSLDKLNKLVVASLQPLKAEGASKSGAECEGRARRVKVEDRGCRRRDRCGVVAGVVGLMFVGVVGIKGGRGGRK